jgi:uncharacterized protein YaiI (UPF0178 family)
VLCMSHRQRLVTLVRVAKQLDAADQYILQHVAPHDLVITADIPLAASVIAKNAVTLDPRSEVYTPENISGASRRGRAPPVPMGAVRPPSAGTAPSPVR